MARKRKTVQARAPSKKQLSKWQRENRLKRYFMLAGAAIFVLIIGILAFGYYQEEVAKYRIVVARVNNAEFTSGDYAKVYGVQLAQSQSMMQYWQSQLSRTPTDDQSRALAQFASSQINQISQGLLTLGNTTLEGMIEDEILRVQSSSYGVSVTPEQIQQSIMTQFQVDPKEDESLEEATKRQSDFQANYKKALVDTGLSEQEFNRLVEASLLREMMQQQLAAQVPASGEQVHVLGVLSRGEDEADAVVRRITQQNEDFGAVAAEVSLDNASKAQGGDMGWIPYGAMDPAFETVAFSSNPGEVSKPITTDQGFWVIKVIEKANREIDANTLEQLKSSALDRWFVDQKKVNKIERNLTPDVEDWAYDLAAKADAKKAKQALK